VAIKGPLTTPVGGGIDLYVCLRPARYLLPTGTPGLRVRGGTGGTFNTCSRVCVVPSVRLLRGHVGEHAQDGSLHGAFGILLDHLGDASAADDGVGGEEGHGRVRRSGR